MSTNTWTILVNEKVNKSKFLELSLNEKGYVMYGDNNQGNILGIGKISNAFRSHGNKESFDSESCIIHDGIYNKIRYMISPLHFQNVSFPNESDIWTWHRRVAHHPFKTLGKTMS
ncbi:hypothetical protein Lal_00015574 [Lupinus albus]|nr:hypothetical protein Lal_00015574 [Lupinus albus]